MYYILVYDVNVNRVVKMLKIVREYLNHVQNSVFEGELTDAQLEELKYKITELMNEEEDSVIIYCVGSKRWSNREVLGVEKNSADNFV
ncbi:CRISPR-associated endonuclease Cas2 [Rhodohalobacter sp. 614A]|uniref:CRISPR-associated endonuclease Cas2 n=1 Tax=Rhodohalobacter sp. 614A TaxID=2908649 RepID=UPI001F165EFE|nr:CRISPR-associated endonuclease Cas2 [Rhodohalobacter sp. 614A]